MKRKQFFLYKYIKNILISNSVGYKSLNQQSIYKRLELYNIKTLHNFYINSTYLKKNNTTTISLYTNHQFNSKTSYLIKQNSLNNENHYKNKKYYILMLYKKINFTKNLDTFILNKYYLNFIKLIYTEWFLNNANVVLFYNIFLSFPYNIRSLRLIFGLPVNGQKSRSNNNTNKKKQSLFLTSKYYYFSKIFSKTSLQLFKAEYVNLFWQSFYYPSWLSNKKSLSNIKSKSRYIDINSLSLLHCFNNKSFTKSNKTKKKFDNKKKNLGFKFGFTKKFKNKLLITT